MEIQIAVAKIHKYAVSNSGDTVEVIERPNGGVSVVMADGQSSGRGAKWISTFVVRKVIGLLADGVRDGAAARAASDSLYTERGGKVSATLNILSVDMASHTLVITCNNPSPALLAHCTDIAPLIQESQPIGTRRGIRPYITQVALESGLSVIIFTDGIVHAGSRTGTQMDITASTRSLLAQDSLPSQAIADQLLEEALRLDDNRPVDDCTIAVLRVTDHAGDFVRRMYVRLPITTG